MGPAESGLLCARPHLWLRESFWDEASATAVTRTFVVEAESARVERLTETMQGYSEAELESLLGEAGLALETTRPGLGDDPDASLVAVLARRAA